LCSSLGQKLLKSVKARQLFVCGAEKYRSLGVSAIAVLFLHACAPAQQTVSCDLPKQSSNPVLAVGPKTDTAKISILIDGTPSMQGFVNNLPSSRYVSTLQLIDSVSSTGWVSAQSELKYYRFGTSKQVLDRATYRRAQLPEFYGNSPDLKVSNIDVAIDKPKADSLSIIITDLYQKDADITLVQNQLNQKYLQPGYAVGIIAIKSEFKGTIYDVGLRGQQFEYSTMGQPASKFHPFYVLFLGSHGNIKHFFEQLKAMNGDLAKQAEFSIFYPQPVGQAALIDPSTVPEPLPKDYRRAKALNDGDVVIRVKDDQPVELLSLNKGADAASLEYRLPYNPLSYGLLINSEQMLVEPTVEKYVNKASGFQPIESKALTLRDWSIDQQAIKLTANINPSDLDPGIYRYVIDVHPTDFQEPNWWAAWSSSEGTLDGSKTHNLLPFLRDLKSSTIALMRAQKPAIARLCYALQKK
jgi:hypothetical protein